MCCGSQQMVLWWEKTQSLMRQCNVNAKHVLYSLQRDSEILEKTGVITGVAPPNTPLYCNSSKTQVTPFGAVLKDRPTV